MCGFVMNEAGECPRCRVAVDDTEREDQRGGKQDILDQVRKLLNGLG